MKLPATRRLGLPRTNLLSWPTPGDHSGHVVAIDGTGRVLSSLQDPDGAYRLTTGATESQEHLYVGSLVMPSLGRLAKSRAGL